MNWAGRPHPLEWMAEWGAPLVLALASVWAASAAGLPLAAKSGAGVTALAVGIAAMRMAGRAPVAGTVGFEPAELEAGGPADELLLDDPLIEVADDSRVVQLFAGPDPTPGELVLKISDYLSEQGRMSPPESPTAGQPYPDASAALHAALANIRASLR